MSEKEIPQECLVCIQREVEDVADLIMKEQFGSFDPDNIPQLLSTAIDVNRRLDRIRRIVFKEEDDW